MSAAVEVKGLRKSYGSREAVRDVSFTVDAGETVAIVGPNGAGKTTTVEILEGFHRRDAGDVSVLGEDPEQVGRAFYNRIGVVLQESEPEPYLTVAEIVGVHSAYYTHPLCPDEVIALVGLTDSADVRVSRLSGGQRRRLDLALGLIGGPELLFLDEPTTGFDPDARRKAWETIGQLKEQGTTIILTTHYLPEAEALADRLVLIDAGQVVTSGSPSVLRREHGGPTRISFELAPGDTEPVPPHAVAFDGRAGSLTTNHPTHALAELTRWALAEGKELLDLQVHGPTLEDIYVDLTT